MAAARGFYRSKRQPCQVGVDVGGSPTNRLQATIVDSTGAEGAATSAAGATQQARPQPKRQSSKHAGTPAAAAAAAAAVAAVVVEAAAVAPAPAAFTSAVGISLTMRVSCLNAGENRPFSQKMQRIAFRTVMAWLATTL